METTKEPARTSGPSTVGPTPRQGEPTAPTRERDEADKQIAERLAAEPEPPQPSQEEADAIKEQALNPAAAEPKAETPQPPQGQGDLARAGERERQTREQQRATSGEQTNR
jgi:hypothetical protein